MIGPRTPVVVGVGQHSERIEDDGYEALSHVDLAARAALAAFRDCGADPEAVAQAVDTVAATRQFEISTPLTPIPFGSSTNVPRSIASRAGADPARAVLEIGGGQSPQKLLTEFCGEIAAGRADVVLLAGGEAMSTVRHLAGHSTLRPGQDDDGAAAETPDWSEDPGGQLDDRGYGIRGLVAKRAIQHGLTDVVSQYAMFDNARRAQRGETREQYAAGMGALFAPFTEVAARNPHSVAPEAIDAASLVRVDERNRMISEPYPRLLVSRDLVNQGAAVLLMSTEAADRLGVPTERRTYLHGHCDVREQRLYDRPDFATAPSQAAAVRAALDLAGVGLDEVNWFDLYSCFPVAVSQLLDALGLEPDDPRGFTLTGGLPFFGGPGNNYSMHAIAEVVDRVRRAPGTYGLVSSNGGTFSKCSVGVYSTEPAPWRAGHSAAVQAGIDAEPLVPLVDQPDDGWVTVETWTVRHSRRGRTAVVVARDAQGRRLVAAGEPGDDELLDWFDATDQPVDERLWVHATGPANRVTVTPARMAELHPPRPVGFRDVYDFLQVRRDGAVLEVTLDRTDVGNVLHPPAHEELAGVLDAFEADRDLRVAVITGSGEVFCAGTDTAHAWSGQPDYLPRSGFAGLTSRRLTKPVVAAVNGDATGGGAEAVLACTLVVIAADAGFCFDHVVQNRLAEAGGLVRLPSIVGRQRAAELVLTGRWVGAEEALGLGLVNRVAPHGKALELAHELAAQVAEAPAPAAELSLQVLEAASADDVLAAVREPRWAYDDIVLGE